MTPPTAPHRPKPSRQKTVARIGGNFGISFFTPLVGTSIADSIYEIEGLGFVETIIIAAVASALTTGLSISRELAAYGERRQ